MTTTVRDAVAAALYTTRGGESVPRKPGTWHVVVRDEHLLFATESEARAAAAAYLRSYRNAERLAYGTARAVRRLNPATGRRRASGMSWDAGRGWVRLYPSSAPGRPTTEIEGRPDCPACGVPMVADGTNTNGARKWLCKACRATRTSPTGRPVGRPRKSA